MVECNEIRACHEWHRACYIQFVLDVELTGHCSLKGGWLVAYQKQKVLSIIVWREALRLVSSAMSAIQPVRLSSYCL